MLRFNPNLWALPAWPCAGNRRPHGRAPRWCALGRQELLGGVRPAVRAKPVGLAVPPSCPRTCCWDRKRVPILAHKWTTLRTGLCHQVQRVRPPGGPTPAAGAGQRPPTRPPPWPSVEGGPSPSPRSGRGLRGSLGPGVPASAPTALTCSHTSTPSSAPSAGRHPPAERGGRGGTTKGLGSSSAPPSHVALGSPRGPAPRVWADL